MTVEELIEKLSKYDKDLEIVGIRGSLELEYKQVTEVVENGGAVIEGTYVPEDILCECNCLIYVLTDSLGRVCI